MSEQKVIRVGVLVKAREQNGGTLLYTRSMLEALARMDRSTYRVVVVSERDNHDYDDLDLPTVRVHSLMTIPLLALLHLPAICDFDIIVAPVYSTVLLFWRVPFVFTLHDLQERYFPQNFSLLTRMWRRFTNWALSNGAARVICESNYVRNDIVRFVGIDEQKVLVIPAPPVSNLTHCMTDGLAVTKVRTQFSLPAVYVFYPAQFWPHKNHVRLIDAFAKVLKRHPDCILVLTGSRRYEYERVFLRVHELMLEDHVRHIGYVELKDLAALYKGATLVVIPTLFESISIPIFEAFAVGCAVCASNVVALPEQVGDAGLLFDPMSSDDIADKMNLLLEDSTLRERLIERGRERLLTTTQNQHSMKLAHLIKSVVEDNSSQVRQSW